MDLTQLANLGEFIGGVAVLVTLVYLAFQVRQNTSVLEAGALQAWTSSNLGVNLVTCQSTELSNALSQGLGGSENLTESNWLQFGLWCQTVAQNAYATHQLYVSGAIGRELYDIEMQRNAGFLRFPGARQWWEASGRTQVPPDFANLLEKTDTSSMQFYWWTLERGFETYQSNADV